MKKWKPLTRPKRYLLCYSVCLFLLFGLGLLFPFYSASAVTVEGSITQFSGVRTYALNGSVTTQQNWDCHGLPCALINGTTSGSRQFSGYSFIYANSNLTTSDQYWDFTLSYQISFPTNAWIQDFDDDLNNIPFRIGAYGRSGTCSVSGYDSGVLRISCSLSGKSSDYFPTSVSVRFGDVDSFVGHWTTAFPHNSEAPILFLDGAVYSFTTANDPSVALLQAQNALIEQQNALTQLTNTKLDQQNQKLDTQIQLQRESNSLQQDLIDAQNESNEQQQEQYEQEKEEEAQREQDAQDSQSGNFLGSLGNLIFPFSSIFNGLGSSSCFTPTNVNNWLNTPGRQYCPWFPSNVSTAVSSVCLGLSTVIVFGFIIKYLNRSDT